MKREGLCINCDNLETCTFVSGKHVLYCEEFYVDERGLSKKIEESKIKRIIKEEETESE